MIVRKTAFGQSITGNPERKQNNAIHISIAITNGGEEEESVCKTGSCSSWNIFQGLPQSCSGCLPRKERSVGTFAVREMQERKIGKFGRRPLLHR